MSKGGHVATFCNHFFPLFKGVKLDFFKDLKEQSSIVLHINFQMHWSNVLNGFNHFYWFVTLYCQSTIDQLISAQLTRLWRFNPTNSVVVPQSLILRYIVSAWILYIKIGLILQGLVLLFVSSSNLHLEHMQKILYPHSWYLKNWSSDPTLQKIFNRKREMHVQNCKKKMEMNLFNLEISISF